tara:strand:- start:768 stop:1028 length:261 start_codon:yes stop_codon:yes gene_type:complete
MTTEKSLNDYVKEDAEQNVDTKNTNAVAELHNACDSLLAKCNEDMKKLIDDFNTKHEDDDLYCDDVDLDHKFDDLADYVEEYTDYN